MTNNVTKPLSRDFVPSEVPSRSSEIYGKLTGVPREDHYPPSGVQYMCLQPSLIPWIRVGSFLECLDRVLVS